MNQAELAQRTETCLGLGLRDEERTAEPQAVAGFAADADPTDKRCA